MLFALRIAQLFELFFVFLQKKRVQKPDPCGNAQKNINRRWLNVIGNIKRKFHRKSISQIIYLQFKIRIQNVTSTIY